jgi:diadenosine tetraphosphate (Ap4A) HIT family hydrolase
MNSGTPHWDQWAVGAECPFDSPRSQSNDHWDLIAPLTISSLYLSRNQTYRGHCLLVFDPRHAVRPDQLSSPEWTSFCNDLYTAQAAIMQTVRPDHLNVEILGNVVPHLHWHIVPRYRGDPRWGGPIWTTHVSEFPVTPLLADEQADLIQKLRDALAR